MIVPFAPVLSTAAVSLRNHIWTHYSEQDKAEAVARGEEVPLFLRKEFQCDQCSRSFSYLTLLESHLKEKHGTGEKAEKEKELCGICGAAVTNLHAHTRLKHTKEEDKKFECGICKKKFAYNNHLQNHRRLAHSNQKPFQCDVCGREFKLLKWMETHRFGHEEVKPFESEVCGIGFSRKQVMKRHISTVHEGKKRTDHKKSQK
ncbi:putative zinc finger protein [Orchesella cincta]|uniref:Putative zinc finger protein n=1 Tax=Orchesella cincta TaxID=48709 RepID=A0A1D2MCZ1_ORCCI|nr:putative zinc finger protein [Orchesella cincta]